MTAVYIEEGLDKGAIWHFGEVAKEQRALAEGKALLHLTFKSEEELKRLETPEDMPEVARCLHLLRKG